MAGTTLMAVPGIFVVTISSWLLLVLSVPSHTVSSEVGWQEARIQQVQKARKQMNKQRQRKHEQAAEKELKEMNDQKKEGSSKTDQK